jgi:hypothetical protein
MRSLFLPFLLLLSGSAAASTIGLRHDLAPCVSQIICNETLPSPVQFARRANLTDGEAYFQVSPAPRGNTPKVNDESARAFAKSRGFIGATFGTCADGREWILAVPSPAPLLSRKADSISVLVDPLKLNCKRFEVEFLANEIEKPRVVKLPVANKGEVQIIAKYLGDGALTIECVAKHAARQGKRLWGWFSVGQGISKTPVFAERLTATKQTDELVRDWVNGIREKAGLSILISSQPVPDQSDFALQMLDASADESDLGRRNLLKEKYKTASKGILLTTSQAVGTDLQDVALQLWFHPAAREKILEKRADLLDVYVIQKKGSLRILLAFSAKG